MRSWRRLALLLPMTALASCAGNEPSSADQAAAIEQPIPRAICVDVRCEGDEVDTWGAEDEWREDLVLVLRDTFRVSEVVFHSKAGDPPPDDADMLLEIVVKAISPREAVVEESAATLEVLAYVTIPLLPIWIRDVRKDPGVQLELTATVVGGNEGSLFRQIAVPDLLTSYSERVPFFSWTTLGAVLLPPFFFKGDERSAHMEGSMGERVRRLAAAEVAKELNQQEIQPELLWDFEVRPDPEGWVISFLVEPEVGRLAYRLGSKKGKPVRIETLALGRVLTVTRGYRPPLDFEGLVRIEATSLATSGIVRSYTLRIADVASRNEELP